MNKPNPQTPTIILYHKSEITVQNNRQYLVITDKAGIEHKISEKRQSLWGVFKEARDAEPFILIYETYNNVQYVADAKPITDELLKLAVQDLGLKVSNQQTEERNRSQAIAYAKDLSCANRIDHIDHMFDMATKIYRFIKGLPSEESIE